MDFDMILPMLVAKFPILAGIFLVLGLLVVLAQVIIPLTPSKKDDAAWDKIKQIPVLGSVISALVAFAPIQKK